MAATGRKPDNELGAKDITSDFQGNIIKVLPITNFSKALFNKAAVNLVPDPVSIIRDPDEIAATVGHTN